MADRDWATLRPGESARVWDVDMGPNGKTTITFVGDLLFARFDADGWPLFLRNGQEVRLGENECVTDSYQPTPRARCLMHVDLGDPTSRSRTPEEASCAARYLEAEVGTAADNSQRIMGRTLAFNRDNIALRGNEGEWRRLFERALAEGKAKPGHHVHTG